MESTKKIEKTTSQKMNADIVSLLKSRHTLIWITTRDERRVEGAIKECGAECQLPVWTWDLSQGLYNEKDDLIDTAVSDPMSMLKKIRDTQARRIYVMRDLHQFVRDQYVVRGLRTLARDLQSAKLAVQRVIVIVSTSSEIPPEWAAHAVVLEYPLPDRAEMGELLDDVVSALPPELKSTALTIDSREAAIDAAIGLSAEEAVNTYSRSLVMTKKIDVAIVAGEKKRVIGREKVLTWHDADPRGLDAIAGLDVAKAWSMERKVAFTAAARAYGLPSPKGILLLGQSGCGKSLFAKCVATTFEMPLLRLDPNGLKSKYVGESEANFRKALAVAEAMSPCVLWVDEVDKALKGATGDQGDGGVAADQFGTLLTWMQERKGAVFIVATANDVSGIPPEFLRKGRFDENFFVDLPTSVERVGVLEATMRQYGRNFSAKGKNGALGPDAKRFAEATVGFTGAEIANLVPDAMFIAFADEQREVTIDDLLKVASQVVPLSRTAAEKVEALRKWAKTRARNASSSEEVVDVSKGRSARALDFGGGAS